MLQLNTTEIVGYLVHLNLVNEQTDSSKAWIRSLLDEKKFTYGCVLACLGGVWGDRGLEMRVRFGLFGGCLG